MKGKAKSRRRPDARPVSTLSHDRISPLCFSLTKACHYTFSAPPFHAMRKEMLCLGMLLSYNMKMAATAPMARPARLEPDTLTAAPAYGAMGLVVAGWVADGMSVLP